MRAEHCGGRRCGLSAQARAGFPAGLLQHRTVAAPAGVTARDSALAGAPAQPGAYAGICIRLRRLLSNADVGTKRLSRLTVVASYTRCVAAAVPVSGLVVTKLDGTARGGIVVAIHAYQFEQPARFSRCQPAIHLAAKAAKGGVVFAVAQRQDRKRQVLQRGTAGAGHGGSSSLAARCAGRD